MDIIVVETFVKVLLIESKIVLTILFRGPFVEVLVDVTAKKNCEELMVK